MPVVNGKHFKYTKAGKAAAKKEAAKRENQVELVGKEKYNE